MNPVTQIQEFEYLCLDYAHLFEKVSVEFPDWERGKDPRLCLIVFPQQALISYRITLSFINATLRDNVWWESNINSIPFEARQSNYTAFDLFQKYSHFVMFFSHFESELRRIYRMYKPAGCENGNSAFYSIFESLFTKLNLKEYIPFLAFANEIRNVLHNNGYFFHKKDKLKKHSYQGIDYKFEEGIAVEFVTPSLLVNVYKDFITLTNEIVSHKEICSLKT